MASTTRYSRSGAATTTATLDIDGIDEAIRLLKSFSKDANADARDAAQSISEREAMQIRTAGRNSDRQSALVAETVRARRDRFPAIAAGGGKRLPVSGKRKTRPTAGDLFFGAEFGAMAYPQFRIHRGREGYWFYPTLRRDSEWMTREWMTALDGIAEKWAG